ncbi:MAG TPA: hypothetical protein VMB72_12435 [Acidimicrobiales bacterium]|nr:hypothetical protein [Acidimicrobiales bacterium]
MPTRRRPSDQLLQHPSEEEFEAVVAAALKVDPAGLSGKHHREAEEPKEDAEAPE